MFEGKFQSHCTYMLTGRVFWQVDELVALEAEVVFTACWLALQGDVLEVEYRPMKMYINEG